MKKLLLEAMQGDSSGWRKIGMRLWKRRFFRRNKELAVLCLKKAMEEGDEEAFFFYHLHVDQDNFVMEEKTYQEIKKEYYESEDEEKRKELRKYLKLFQRKNQKKGREF